MINQKHFIVAIILFGLLLTLPLIEAKLTFPINFKNIFSVSSSRTPASSSLLSNNRLKIDNSMGQIAFWNENNNLSGDNALFWDNGNKRLGIGVITPQNKLEVLDSIYATNPGGITTGHLDLGKFSDGTAVIAKIKHYFSSSNAYLGFDGNNDRIVLMDATVGIGTTTPQNKLEVLDSIYATNPGGITTGHLDLGKFSDGTAVIAKIKHYFSSSNAYLGFDGNNDRIVLMDATVGIGTTNPQYKLDVTGKVHASEGFKLPIINTGNVPTCNAAEEGLVLIKKQDGVNLSSRKVIICMKTGEGIYSWESLLGTSWGSYASKEVESSSISNAF